MYVFDSLAECTVVHVSFVDALRTSICAGKGASFLEGMGAWMCVQRYVLSFEVSI